MKTTYLAAALSAVIGLGLANGALAQTKTQTATNAAARPAVQMHATHHRISAKRHVVTRVAAHRVRSAKTTARRTA